MDVRDRAMLSLSVGIAAWTKLALRINPVLSETHRWLAEGRYRLDDLSDNRPCRCDHCMRERVKRFREWYGSDGD